MIGGVVPGLASFSCLYALAWEIFASISAFDKTLPGLDCVFEAAEPEAAAISV